MQRRKFLIGMGSLAAGSSAAMGTGAFSSVSANRSVDVAVAADSNAFLALEAGDSGLVTGTDDGALEINLDGSAEGAEGVNMNAKTSIGYIDTSGGPYGGSPSRPWLDNYAFTIRNQGTQTLETVLLKYELENSDWITDDDVAYRGKNDPISSYIQFTPYAKDTGTVYARNFLQVPDRDNKTGVYENNIMTDLDKSPAKFRPGDKIYVSVLVDTTRANADSEDKLSGTLSISASDPV